MTDALRLTAFQMVRPRGPDLDIPAATPRKTNTSKAPAQGNVHQALDRNGRRTVSLERRTKGSITVEGRSMSAATLARNQKIRKASL